jgi:hypothetical protein
LRSVTTSAKISSSRNKVSKLQVDDNYMDDKYIYIYKQYPLVNCCFSDTELPGL